MRCLTIPNVNANLQEKCEVDTRFFAGDWGDIHSVLPFVTNDEQNESAGYNVIIMAETVYSLPTLPSLYELIKKVCLFLFSVELFNALTFSFMFLALLFIDDRACTILTESCMWQQRNTISELEGDQEDFSQLLRKMVS